MIEIVVGMPGSGKTYFAVTKIFNNFSDSKKAKKDLKKSYINCYTNINGLKFNNLKNVYEYDHDIFDSHIRKLHKCYKKGYTDNDLIEICKELDIYKTFFVVDEFHNYFDKEKVHLVWWLSYHRHLFHDFIFITQSLNLVHSKYKSFCQNYYKAKPSSLVLFNNFKYDIFVESRMTKASRAGTFSLSKISDIFDIYHSGDSVKSKNIILQYILYFVGFVLLLVIVAFWFYDGIKSDESDNKVKKPVSAIQRNSNIDNISNNSISDDRIYKRVLCSDEFCKIDDITLPVNVFNKIFVKYNIDILDRKVIVNQFKEIHVILDSNYVNLFTKKKDDIQSSISLFPFSDNKENITNKE